MADATAPAARRLQFLQDRFFGRLFSSAREKA
jgi:hypothetical protein